MNDIKTEKEKTLYKLSKKEYQNGATLTFENAKNLLEVAKKASEIDKFGVATSLLVIAAEELAKASILKIKAIHPLINIKNLSSYFHSHKVKHESIANIFFASNDYMNETKQKSTKTSKELNENKDTDIDFWIVIIIITIIIGVIYFFTKHIKTVNDSKDLLEDMRKSGFYVEFNQEKQKWEVPKENFDKEKYNEFSNIINEVFETIEKTLFGDKIHKNNIIEFADKLSDKAIITEHLIKDKIS